MATGLREIRRVRPPEHGEARRRWFHGETLDLYVWERGGRVESFELCYGKPADEHSLRWSREGGLAHTRIDDGESTPLRNDTPIAIPDGAIDVPRIALDFEREAAALEPPLYRLVLGTLYRL